MPLKEINQQVLSFFFMFKQIPYNMYFLYARQGSPMALGCPSWQASWREGGIQFFVRRIAVLFGILLYLVDSFQNSQV